MPQQRRGLSDWMQPLLALVACESIFWGVTTVLRPAFLTSEVLLCLVTANLAGLLSWRCRKRTRVPLKRGEEFLIAFVFLVFVGRLLANSPIGRALTFTAAERDDVEALRLLLTLSAPRNFVPLGESSTLLNAALLSQSMGATKLLLEAGADPNRKDLSQWTPLQAARMNGNQSAVVLLQRYGAQEPALPRRYAPGTRTFLDNDLMRFDLRQEPDATR